MNDNYSAQSPDVEISKLNRLTGLEKLEGR